MINQSDIDKLYTKFKVRTMTQKNEKRAIQELTNEIRRVVIDGVKSMIASSGKGLGISNMHQKDIKTLAEKVNKYVSQPIISNPIKE